MNCYVVVVVVAALPSFSLAVYCHIFSFAKDHLVFLKVNKSMKLSVCTFNRSVITSYFISFKQYKQASFVGG